MKKLHIKFNMKKIILLFIILIGGLINTSCVPPGEVEYITVSYNDVYVYAGITYPVHYIDFVPYYWSYNNWILVPRNNYHLIRHFDHPKYFSGYYPRRNYDMPRRPHTRYSNIRHHNDFRRNNIHNHNQRGRNERLNPNNQRPNIRPNGPTRSNNIRHNSTPTRTNIGNRHFGGRR